MLMRTVKHVITANLTPYYISPEVPLPGVPKPALPLEEEKKEDENPVKIAKLWQDPEMIWGLKLFLDLCLDEQWFLTGAPKEAAQDEIMESAHSESGFEEEEEKQGS